MIAADVPLTHGKVGERPIDLIIGCNDDSLQTAILKNPELLDKIKEQLQCILNLIGISCCNILFDPGNSIKIT